MATNSSEVVFPLRIWFTLELSNSLPVEVVNVVVSVAQACRQRQRQEIASWREMVLIVGLN